MKKILEKYAELKEKEAEIQEEINALKPEILEVLDDTEEKKVELTGRGLFSVVSRKVWKYSQGVKGQEELLKELKKTEEQTGTATYTESKSIRFDKVRENTQETK